MKTTGTLAITLIRAHQVFGAVAGDCLSFRLNFSNYLFLFIFIFPQFNFQSFIFSAFYFSKILIRKNIKNSKIKKHN